MKSAFLIVFGMILSQSVGAKTKVVCYWHPGIEASQIDASLCTHIIYSFLGLDANGGLNHLHRSEATAIRFIQNMVALKTQNPSLKCVAAVGGFNPALESAWYRMAESSTTRSNFARNILSFLSSNKLDGIDIDWEYPNHHGDRYQDKDNFNLLLKTLKTTLGAAYTVSVAIGAGQWRSDQSYDIPTIFETVDFVNLMSYDLHGSWNDKTGIHGALFSSALDYTASNVDASVKFLLNKNVARSKIIMGIAAYGVSFKLNNVNQNGVGAPATGGGTSNYNQICPLINSRHYNDRWDNDQKVPYAFRDKDWIGYENVKSVTEKANYINNQQLGGAMFWSVDGDDFNNVCGAGRFPLISTVKRILK